MFICYRDAETVFIEEDRHPLPMLKHVVSDLMRFGKPTKPLVGFICRASPASVLTRVLETTPSDGANISSTKKKIEDKQDQPEDNSLSSNQMLVLPRCMMRLSFVFTHACDSFIAEQYIVMCQGTISLPYLIYPYGTPAQPSVLRFLSQRATLK